MLRWLGPNKAQIYSNIQHARPHLDGNITDDPLATIDPDVQKSTIYSVSRINPLFIDSLDTSDVAHKPEKPPDTHLQRNSPQNQDKSNSSGYGGSYGSSSHNPIYSDQLAIAVLEHNPLKPSKLVTRDDSVEKTTPAGSSSSGTLNTIPEGKLDLSVPVPVWPDEDENWVRSRKDYYDSLVDETLLLYTSFSYVPDGKNEHHEKLLTVKEILVDLLNGINATIEGKTDVSPEEMLKRVNERIALSIEALKLSTEEEVKNLCINLSNCRKTNSVLKAFGSSSSSAQSSPEWNTRRIQHADAEEIYRIPSGSSSSGFSDSIKLSNRLPVFVHEDLSSVRNNGMRNALIYGTLCRGGCNKTDRRTTPKKRLLRATDDKPSVWEQYYGMNSVPDGEVKYTVKPTDVPLFPGGRPEADFTLDVPRSELLSKRMKADKKWRCRCRLLTSFLGIVFFLLSVMAVSLVLTRGKRMFGSMV